MQAIWLGSSLRSNGWMIGTRLRKSSPPPLVSMVLFAVLDFSLQDYYTYFLLDFFINIIYIFCSNFFTATIFFCLKNFILIEMQTRNKEQDIFRGVACTGAPSVAPKPGGCENEEEPPDRLLFKTGGFRPNPPPWS